SDEPPLLVRFARTRCGDAVIPSGRGCTAIGAEPLSLTVAALVRVRQFAMPQTGAHPLFVGAQAGVAERRADAWPQGARVKGLAGKAKLNRTRDKSDRERATLLRRPGHCQGRPCGRASGANRGLAKKDPKHATALRITRRTP